MRKELEERLRNLCPSVFRNGTVQNDGMVFGFQHGDGWFPLLEELLSYVAYKVANPPSYRYLLGTHPLVNGERIDLVPCPDDPLEPHKCECPLNHLRLDQVKEKFGGLRFYFSGYPYDSRFGGMVEMAERMSYRMCEACGSLVGTTTSTTPNGSWIKTLCAEHRLARDQGNLRAYGVLGLVEPEWPEREETI